MKKMLFIALAAVASFATAQVQLDYEAGMTMNAGSETLAPYYIMAGRGGTVTQQHSALLHAGINHKMDTTTRLSWGAGVELWGGWASSTDYLRFSPVETVSGIDIGPWVNPQHPARAWVQQAFAEGKYRGVYVTLGQKQHHSALLNDALSSGDMTMSSNARPMPGMRAGFVNFQNIPFTHGWVQIDGELGYYKMTDDHWLKNHYNEYNHFVTTGSWLHYKNLYLRTKPGQRVVFTVGMQAACQFGGTRIVREEGIVTQEIKQKSDLEAFFKAFIPGSSTDVEGEEYYEGNHQGSWDIAMDVNLNNGAIVRGYYQSPWNDGSGIGKLNGFDGLWGIEYKAAQPGIISGAVVEYIDLTNQSGPIHWAPADFEGTPITSEATGADDYYNNYAFNGYQALGQSIGSPFVPGPIYNLNGYMRFRDTMIRGFHAGINGNVGSQLAYRLLGSYRKAWGTPFVPRLEPATCTSLMLEATYSPSKVNGLDIKAQLALDHGKLLGNNVGALVSVTYNGNFTLSK